jgi:hypothetical protein
MPSDGLRIQSIGVDGEAPMLWLLIDWRRDVRADANRKLWGRRHAQSVE